MITLIDHLPDHVVGIVGSGKITDHDYKTVLIPALEKAIRTHRKVNVLYVLANDFTGITLGAMWDDAAEGLLHLRSWDRVAMVCGSSLMKKMGKMFGAVLPLSLRTYSPSEIKDARIWVCGREPEAE